MSDLIQTHETRHVDDLQAHEFNREIYNTNATDLIDRIEEQGYEDTFGRITIKPDGTILSGHRRWKAAQAAGIEELPVEVVETNGEFEERRLILLANEHRDKTPAEKISAGEAWEELESEKAKERQGTRTDLRQDFDESKAARADEKAAEKVGTSKETLRKGQQVKQKAEEGDEKAQEEWEKLESGEQSIHGAHKEVKKTENTTDDEPEKKDPREQHTELSLVRVLEDGACIYTSGGDTYLVPKDQLPE
jgi:ParB family chromosome partitioning protein